MLVTKQRVVPICNIKVNNESDRQVSFHYLGSMITTDGKCDHEIKRRISMAKDAFIKLKEIVCNTKISRRRSRLWSAVSFLDQSV